MNKGTFRTIFWTAFVTAVLVGVLAFFGSLECGQRKASGKISSLWDGIHELRTRLVQLDSLADYLKGLKQSSVTKWYERPVRKEAKPETVYVYKDTINPDTIWGHWPEAIISLDKKGKNLDFTSLAPADTWCDKAIAKAYHYRVSDNFSIRTKGDGFYVETARDFWTRFHGGVAADAGFKVWGDSTMPSVDPRVRGWIGWGPVSVGPTLTLHGVQLTIQAGVGF